MSAVEFAGAPVKLVGRTRRDRRLRVSIAGLISTDVLPPGTRARSSRVTNPPDRTSFPRLLVVAIAISVALGTIALRAEAADPARVEWSPEWPRVRLVEGLDIIALTAASYAIDAWAKPSLHPHWTRPILFDQWARSQLRGETATVQRTARVISDYAYKGAVFAPYIVDVYVVALGVHQHADVAIQMLLINLQSLGISGVANLAAEHWIGRQRPYARDCGPDGAVRNASGQRLANSCQPRVDNESFPSGHAAATATMAGLTCVHHQHLPLYGGGVADLVPCLIMTATSITTGVARLVADRHWASDVLVGWSIGVLSGYVLPSLLHYGFGSGRPVAEARMGDARVVPTPMVFTRGAGIGLVGIL